MKQLSCTCRQSLSMRASVPDVNVDIRRQDDLLYNPQTRSVFMFDDRVSNAQKRTAVPVPGRTEYHS